MTNSESFGPFKVRPHIVKGHDTGKWCVDVPATLSSDGKRKRTLFEHCKDARREARELQSSVNPITGLLRMRKTASGITLGDAVDGWLEAEKRRVRTLKKRKNTLRINDYRLRALRRHFSGDALKSITSERLLDYQGYRLDCGIKPVSINTEMIALKMVFNWANKNGHRIEKPEIEAIPVSAPKADVVPTLEETVRIYEALPKRLKPLIRFLAETGCRKGEALNLTWDTVDEISGHAEIVSREGWTPKTQHSERELVLGEGLLAMIRALPRSSEYVFPGKVPGQPIKDFKRAWASAVADAKIERKGRQVHVTVQSLRKAYATEVSRKASEAVLQSMLGHAPGTSVTKKYYIHVTEEDRQKASVVLPISGVAV